LAFTALSKTAFTALSKTVKKFCMIFELAQGRQFSDEQ